MPDERKKRMVSVKLDEATIACLDSLAEKIGITRSGMAVRIIHESLPEIKVLDRLGVLRWGSWLEWIIAKVKEHAKFVEHNFPDQKKISITLWLDEKDVETLTLIGNKFLLTKAKFASNIIIAVIPELRVIQKLGLVDAIHWVEGIKKKMTQRSKAKLEKKGIGTI